MTETDMVAVSGGVDRFDPAGLAAWRDAAIRGDVPLPYRSDRWQPLRAGVLNLWEYDTAEIWYADGRLQMQGANESGKSTLMTLTTLLLLAGDTSSRNIDTLGESGKRFRYYVEPSNHPLDRRDPTRQKHRGWAWQEYGRVGDSGPEYFTTLLFAETRRADGDLKLQWCTLHGSSRVRDGLTLVTAGLIADPQQVKETDGLTLHRTGAAYREEIARTLFGGGPERLDQIIRILRVVRTPKIGDKLDLNFLTSAFRNALPPLSEDEIRQLADGWDQLERLRTERDTAEQALAAVSEFTRHRWRPWADAVIRSAADPVIAAFTAFDKVTREERQARQGAHDLQEQVDRIDKFVDADINTRDQRQAQADTLQGEQAYQDAISAVTNAEHRAEEARKAGETANRSIQRARQAEGEIGPATKATETAVHTLAKAEERAQAAVDRVAAHAAPAGLMDATARFLPHRDTIRLDHAAGQRLVAVARALELIAEHGKAATAADGAAHRAHDARLRAEAAAAELEQAGTGLERSVAVVADQLVTWARDILDAIRPAPGLVESWVRGVDGIVQADPPRSILAAAIAHDHINRVRGPLEQRRAGLVAELGRNRDEQEQAAAAVAEVETERDPRPGEPELWQRRTRPDGVTHLGAPLWRLVEVVGDRDDVDLATLEATLDASGILQAWVTPDGAWVADRDGYDTVLCLPAATTSGPHATTPESTSTLRSILRPADDAGFLADVIDELLRSVELADSLAPAAGSGLDRPAVTRDGQWRHGALGGRAAPTASGPRLLGAAARAADRQRRLACLRARLAELRDAERSLGERLTEAQELIDALDQAVDAAPSDSGVVAAVLALRQAERQASESDAAATLADKLAGEAQAKADTVAAAVAAHVDQHGLPPRHEQVEQVRSALHDFKVEIRLLGDAMHLLPQLREAAQQQADALRRASEAAARAAEDASRDKKEAARLKTIAEAAASALSQDAQQILARVQQLRNEIDELERTIATHRGERDRMVEKKIRAEGTLEQVENRRRQAEADRQAAVDVWFACVDTGLPQQRKVPVPQARHITAAQESARAARSAITPQNWSDDPRAAGQRVQHRWSTMIEAAHILRTRLESLAGRTVRTTPPDDGSPGAVAVVVDGTGVALPPPDAVEALSGLLTRLQSDYDEELTKTISELLGSTFIEHLRDRLVESEKLRNDINAKLAQTPTTTSGLTLRLVRVPVNEERAANEVLAALERDFNMLPAGAQEQIRQFLARRISDAQEDARATGDPDWRSRLAEIIDYRRWFELCLEYRTSQATANGGVANWRPLNRDDHSLLSGGAKVVTLLQPFVAALHAMYDQSGVCPRLMWLDEAFDGVDPTNRSTMLRLLNDCDLDWAVAGPAAIANAATVPVAAIYEVRRAPRPYPGVSLELAVWAGGQMTYVATPDPADLPNLAHAEPASKAGAPDLFSELAL